MYEKLNVEKAERIKKQQNTLGRGKGSFKCGVIFLFYYSIKQAFGYVAGME